MFSLFRGYATIYGTGTVPRTWLAGRGWWRATGNRTLVVRSPGCWELLIPLQAAKTTIISFVYIY